MSKCEFEAFQSHVWKLERLAKRSGGFLKIIPAQPTKLKAYAARLYRATSVMSFVDLENVQPLAGEVCAFTSHSWSMMPLWDLWDTFSRCRGRITLAVVVGSSHRIELDQVLLSGSVEIARLPE